jgi:threonine/homoserine/homoserine lactone efflux protein
MPLDCDGHRFVQAPHRGRYPTNAPGRGSVPPKPRSIETLTALAIFAIVTSVTPGPNNAMVLASGVHFGFRRTVPHMFGIALGYGFMLAIIGAGVGSAMSLSPLVEVGMRLASGGWMV